MIFIATFGKSLISLAIKISNWEISANALQNGETFSRHPAIDGFTADIWAFRKAHGVGKVN